MPFFYCIGNYIIGPQIRTEKTEKFLNNFVWFCVILWLNQAFFLSIEGWALRGMKGRNNFKTGKPLV